MKKYLINGALALVATGFVASCSEKETDFVGTAQQKARAFEQVFEEVYGTIASDQTWGFTDEMVLADTEAVEVEFIDEEAAAPARTRSAGTRASESAHWTDYAKKFDEYLNPPAPNSWTTVKQLSVSEMANYTAFTDDDISVHGTLSDGNFPVGDHQHYRVAAGTTINKVFHINGTYGVYNDAVIYIEGTVHMNWNTVNGATIVVASGGEIILDGDQKFSNSGRFLVMAGGKISGTKNVLFDITNGNKNYNAGEIDFPGQLNVNGSDFYNNGTVNVDALTNTSADGLITNFGHITARTNWLQADAYNSNVVNGCYMRFKENAGFGGLTLLENSRIDVGAQMFMTGGFWGTKVNQLYTLSEINAKSMYFSNAVISGPSGSDEFAVVKTEKMLISHGNDLNVYNYAYIDMGREEFYDYQNNKLDINDENVSAYHVIGGIKADGSSWCNSPIQHWANDANLYIPAGDCTGSGYSSNGGGGGETHEHGDGSRENKWDAVSDEWAQVTSQTGRIFCEDLGQATREDLDYNDAVFDVIIWQHTHTVQPMKSTTTWTTTDGVPDPGSEQTSAPVTNGSPTVTDTYYAQVELLAAGGTLPLTVAGKEVHDAFGVDVATMVNTYDANSTAYGSFADKASVAIGDETKSFTYNGTTYTLKLTKGISKAIDVPIIVNYSGNQVNELKAGEGKAPHKIFVPTGTPWSVERKNLSLGYPDFGNYVHGSVNQTWVQNRNTYYLCVGNKASSTETLPRVIKSTKVTSSETVNVLWQGSKQFGTSWSLANLDENQFTIDKFYPGDRLRLTGTGFGEENWVNVTLSDNSTPYIIDSEFAQQVKNDDGSYSYPGTATIEVLIDESTAARLNRAISGGKIVFQVQGRNFTLTQIGRVLFQ